MGEYDAVLAWWYRTIFAVVGVAIGILVSVFFLGAWLF